MAFPDFYPPDCPYAECAPAEGEVFRLLVFNTEPGPQDFRSYREVYPSRRFQVPECEACGLSVYRDLADVDAMMERVPRMRGKLVSRGRLVPSHGVISPTPKAAEPSHCTWWIPVEVTTPWAAFEVVIPHQGGV